MLHWLLNIFFSDINRSGSNEATKHEAIRDLEQRIYGRFWLEGVATLRLNSKEFFAIEDLSYGGLKVKSDPENLDRLNHLKHEVLSVQLEVLDQCVSTNIEIIHTDPQSLDVGISFVHKGLETLIFLRAIIEPLKVGANLKVQEQESGYYHFATEGTSIKVFQNPKAHNDLVKVEIDLLWDADPSGLKKTVSITFANDCWEVDKCSNHQEIDKEAVLRHLAFTLIGTQAEPNTVLFDLTNLLVAEVKSSSNLKAS